MRATRCMPQRYNVFFLVLKTSVPLYKICFARSCAFLPWSRSKPHNRKLPSSPPGINVAARSVFFCMIFVIIPPNIIRDFPPSPIGINVVCTFQPDRESQAQPIVNIDFGGHVMGDCVMVVIAKVQKIYMWTYK